MIQNQKNPNEVKVWEEHRGILLRNIRENWFHWKKSSFTKIEKEKKKIHKNYGLKRGNREHEK